MQCLITVWWIKRSGGTLSVCHHTAATPPHTCRLELTSARQSVLALGLVSADAHSCTDVSTLHAISVGGSCCVSVGCVAHFPPKLCQFSTFSKPSRCIFLGGSDFQHETDKLLLYNKKGSGRRQSQN